MRECFWSWARVDIKFCASFAVRFLGAMSPLQVAHLMAAAPVGSRFSAGFDNMVMKLCQAGPEQLMVITDFDQTLLGPAWWLSPNHPNHLLQKGCAKQTVDQVDCTYDVSQCHKDNLPWQQQSNTDTPKIAANTAFLFISYLGTLTHLFELWPWVSFSVSMCFPKVDDLLRKGWPTRRSMPWHHVAPFRWSHVSSGRSEANISRLWWVEQHYCGRTPGKERQRPCKTGCDFTSLFRCVSPLKCTAWAQPFCTSLSWPIAMCVSEIAWEKTFAWLNRWDVPFLVVSAGLREFLVPILEKSGAPLPSNTVLLSNSLEEAAVSVTSPEKVPRFEARSRVHDSSRRKNTGSALGR